MMRVLHVIGSSNDKFMFDLSFLYGKNCPLNIFKDSGATADAGIDTVQYDYALYVPGAKSSGVRSSETTLWYFIRGESIDVQSIKESTPSAIANIDPAVLINAASDSKYKEQFLPQNVQGPLSVGKFISLLEREQQHAEYQLMVPHFFDYLGVTTIRSMFEDVLKIPAPGPTPTCGVLSQNKALTRSILGNVPNVKIPKGEGLYYRSTNRYDNNNLCELPNVSIALPFVVKPAKEDNSRGVSLCRTEDQVKPALIRAFEYGDWVVVEEFIPGREIRAGCVLSKLTPQFTEKHEQNHFEESVHVLSCKVEYVLDKNHIRLEEDKLTYVNKTGTIDSSSMKEELVQVKCERRFLTPNSEAHALSSQTIAKMDAAIKSAHKALGSRDYSMFDFRVHEDTGDVYLIEPCSFWTFSTIAFLSLAIEHSDEFSTGDLNEEQGERWRSVAQKMWLNASRGNDWIN